MDKITHYRAGHGNNVRGACEHKLGGMGKQTRETIMKTIDLQNITGDNAASVIAEIEEAYANLPIAKFCKLLHVSGCSVSGTKKAMLNQARNFVNRLAVTEVQCRF